jgi:hypothetical protein
MRDRTEEERFSSENKEKKKKEKMQLGDNWCGVSLQYVMHGPA